MIKINDYVISFIKKFSLVFLGVLGTSFLNRYLGPELRGSYSYMMNVITLWGSIINLGIQQTFTIELRKNPKNYEKLRETYLNIFAFQFVVYMILILAYFIISGADWKKFYIFFIPSGIMLGQCNYLLISKHFTYRGIIYILNSFIRLVAYACFFFFAPKNVYWIMLFTGIMDILFLLAGFAKLKPKFNLTKIDFKYFSYLLKIAFFPLCISFLNSINYSIDIFFLEKSVSLTDVGLYSVGVGLSTYVWMIPEIFAEVILSRTSKSNAIESVKQSLRFSTTIIIFVIIAIVLLGRFVINLLYGEDFLGSYPITLVLMGGVPVMSFFKIIAPYVLSTGKTYVNFIILLASAILNIILNALMIPLWGVYGAGIASIFSYCLCGFSFFIYFMKTEKLELKDLLFVNKKDITDIFALLKKHKSK